jgi:hypothetical protein
MLVFGKCGFISKIGQVAAGMLELCNNLHCLAGQLICHYFPKGCCLLFQHDFQSATKRTVISLWVHAVLCDIDLGFAMTQVCDWGVVP